MWRKREPQEGRAKGPSGSVDERGSPRILVRSLVMSLSFVKTVCHQQIDERMRVCETVAPWVFRHQRSSATVSAM